MKKFMRVIILISAVALSFCGCSTTPFPTRDSLDEIQSIEIVSAEDSFEYTVLKTLNEKEMEDFIEKFKTLSFRKYVGDPPAPHGNCIRIVYKRGNYDMISHFSAEYVEEGVRQFYWRSCDEDKFNELIEEFLGETSNDTSVIF